MKGEVMRDMDDKAKEVWDDTKEKADDMGDKAKAKYHETKGRMSEKMKQDDKQKSM